MAFACLVRLGWRFRLGAGAGLALLLAGCPSEDDAAAGGDGEAAGPTPCGGELTCAPDEACVREDYEPACSGLGDIEDPTDADCPEGRSLSACGGPGLPCCCEPDRPPSTYTCAAAQCEAELSCDCVDEPCDARKVCTLSGTKETLVCEDIAE